MFQFFCITVAFASCGGNTEVQSDSIAHQVSANQNNVTKVNNTKNTKSEPKTVYSSATLIFFMPDFKEIEDMKRHNDATLQYQLEFLFKDFKENALFVKQTLQTERFSVDMSTSKVFFFTDKDGKQTKIDISERNMLMGQIFYSPVDSILIIDGQLSSSELRTQIQTYFKIENLYLPKIEQELELDSLHLDTIVNN